VSSAGEIIEFMSPTYPYWVRKPDGWIFRGQANADWSLQASAMRTADAFEKYGIFVSDVGRAAWVVRRERQDRALEAFMVGLEEAGVVVPSRAPSVRTENELSSGAEPPREVFPLMALAQHHGLPTLLLDWTRRARVAAYFAAAEAAEQMSRGAQTGSHLAVWALRIDDKVSWSAGHPRPDSGMDTDRLEIYRSSGGGNPNLRAQSGLFTLLSSVRDVSIEQHLAAWCAQGHAVNDVLLMKFTLPHGEVGKLLRLLSYEGVTGASMFPGPDGVVRAMRERALWDDSRKRPAT
jgi:hypothetical protein